MRKEDTSPQPKGSKVYKDTAPAKTMKFKQQRQVHGQKTVEPPIKRVGSKKK